MNRNENKEQICDDSYCGIEFLRVSGKSKLMRLDDFRAIVEKLLANFPLLSCRIISDCLCKTLYCSCMLYILLLWAFSSMANVVEDYWMLVRFGKVLCRIYWNHFTIKIYVRKQFQICAYSIRTSVVLLHAARLNVFDLYMPDHENESAKAREIWVPTVIEYNILNMHILENGKRCTCSTCPFI